MEESLIYLHIPHTAGRVIRRFLWQNDLLKDIQHTHNGEQTAEILSKSSNWDKATKYFVKRPVVERMIGQFLHYGARLANTGRVNDLYLNKIKENQPDFDANDPVQFVSLEENRNHYCKFILGFTDFSKPMADADFERVLAMKSTLHWDEFQTPAKVPVFEKLLNQKIDLTTVNHPSMTFMHQTEKRNVLLADKELAALIEKNNLYDNKLFNSL
jgi:hypothetical protein